ncbi:MAG TPA: hypothetical protein VHS05_11385 [Pyrinomonadaceae bacterium]|nr:hypothetical protein [Pyrinomonadaceae bacterium]
MQLQRRGTGRHHVRFYRGTRLQTNELTDLGTTGTLREALTWHKDLLATLRRFDEPEVAFVVPDSAFEAHRYSNRGLMSELNGRGEDGRWG